MTVLNSTKSATSIKELSFMCAKSKFKDVKKWLGMENADWCYYNGSRQYQYCSYFGGVEICHNNEESGIRCVIDDYGFRAFEKDYNGDLRKLFETLINEEALSITKIVIANEDDKILNMKQITKDMECRNYVSSLWRNEIYTNPAAVIFGSPSSDVQIKFHDYSKAGTTDKKIVRIGIILKKEKAIGFIQRFLSGKSIDSLFRGVLSHYIRFVEPNGKNRNKGKWENRKYWSDLILGAESAYPRLEDHCRDYTITNLLNLIYSCRQGLKAYVEIVGEDCLLDLISNTNVNGKYYSVVAQWKGRLKYPASKQGDDKDIA